MKNKKSVRRGGRSMAFTMVEILTVVGIIAILIAILIPALTVVRKTAKEAQQRAQFIAIEMALTAFRSDYGDYPPSQGYFDDGSGILDLSYCGAMTLAEALFGWDLMGFHPESGWTKSGKDKDGLNTMVYLDGTETQPEREQNLKKRKELYLKRETTTVFRLAELFGGSIPALFNPDNYVICDVFGAKPVDIGGKTVMAGAPILYYKANTASKTIEPPAAENMRIYNRSDNRVLVYYWGGAAVGSVCPLYIPTEFYDYITDKKITKWKWPSNPDSYLLISAGADGLYGTKDDICNFDPNIPG